MPPFVQTFRALPARSKGIIAVSAVAILAIAFLMLRVAGAPSYSMLSSGLDPAQTGKVTAALDEQGIGYELRNNGTALAVEKAQVSQARVALAGQGVTLDAGARAPPPPGGARRGPGGPPPRPRRGQGASSCSTSRSSAPRTSSSRSPTS